MGDNIETVKGVAVPPSDCTVVGGMGDEITEDAWVDVRVGADGSDVAFNGPVASCRLARLAKNIRIRIFC